MRVALNDSQQIIEVVGQPAGQPADRFEFLRLTQLLFQPAAVGHIAQHGHDVILRAGGEAQLELTSSAAALNAVFLNLHVVACQGGFDELG